MSKITEDNLAVMFLRSLVPNTPEFHNPGFGL